MVTDSGLASAGAGVIVVDAVLFSGSRDFNWNGPADLGRLDWNGLVSPLDWHGIGGSIDGDRVVTIM